MKRSIRITPPPATLSRNAAPGAAHPAAPPAAPISPLALPADAANFLIIGGSFDPPHLWHTRIAASTNTALGSASRRALRTQKAKAANAATLSPADHAATDWHTIFIPAARNPLKPRGPVASDADRLALLQLATQHLPRTHIWTDELDRASAALSPGTPAPPSYTLDTLTRLITLLPSQHQLRLLIGADQAATFHRWLEPRQILALARPIVILRPPVTSHKSLRASLVASNFWSDDELRMWRASTRLTRVSNINSTHLRELLARPRMRPQVLKFPAIHGLLPVVAAEIGRRALYLPDRPPQPKKRPAR